jgi:hypothetical protein
MPVFCFMRFLLLFLIFLFLPHRCYAANLLKNADFEDASLEYWSSSGGSAQATFSSELKHGGNYSLKVSHTKVSSYGFQQVIGDLEGGMFYKLTAFATSDDENIASYFLRVAWYESNDGSGSQLSSPFDSQKETNANGQWYEFSELVQAPGQASSCKVRLVLASKENGLLASAFFDDLIFEESVAPTPTPTAMPTITPTPKVNTPTPTKTPTPTSTSAPTSTPKMVKLTATFSGEILGEDNLDEKNFYPLEASQSSFNEEEITHHSSFTFLPKLILSLGAIFLLSGGLWLWYNLKD